VTDEKALAPAKTERIRIRALPGGKYLEKKVEQELRELLKVQNDVIEKIRKMVEKLESL
jgi:hypothetical protein